MEEAAVEEVAVEEAAVEEAAVEEVAVEETRKWGKVLGGWGWTRQEGARLMDDGWWLQQNGRRTRKRF